MKWRDKITGLPEWITVAALMVFALAVRLAYMHLHPLESRDGIGYILLIQQWHDLDGGALPSFGGMQPPLFCYLARAMMYAGIAAEDAALAVNLLAGTLLLIPVYISARTLWKERSAAVWLGILAAVMPVLVKYSCLRLREGMYLLLAFSTVCAWMLAIRKHHPLRSAAVCGFLAVINLLCRYEALELLAVCGVTLPAAALIPKRRWKDAFKTLAAYIGGGTLGALTIMLLPGMPNILFIYINRIWMHCLGTFINPL